MRTSGWDTSRWQHHQNLNGATIFPGMSGYYIRAQGAGYPHLLILGGKGIEEYLEELQRSSRDGFKLRQGDRVLRGSEVPRILL